jgi:hypothetical protein
LIAVSNAERPLNEQANPRIHLATGPKMPRLEPDLILPAPLKPRKGDTMDAIDLESMPSEELWKLHEAVTAHLGNKLGSAGSS